MIEEKLMVVARDSDEVKEQTVSNFLFIVDNT